MGFKQRSAFKSREKGASFKKMGSSSCGECETPLNKSPMKIGFSSLIGGMGGGMFGLGKHAPEGSKLRELYDKFNPSDCPPERKGDPWDDDPQASMDEADTMLGQSKKKSQGIFSGEHWKKLKKAKGGVEEEEV